MWRIFHLTRSTVFLEFLDCTQSVRVLSNLELEKACDNLIVLCLLMVCIQGNKGPGAFFPN